MPLHAIDKSEIKRILIRATNWVGDAVMTLPALEAVKKNFPQSVVTVLAKPWVQAIYKNHPAADRMMLYDKRDSGFANLGQYWKTIKRLRACAFDLAFLFQNAFEAGLIAYGAKIKYRIGYATDGRGLLLTHPIRLNAEIQKKHQVEYYLYLLRAMGLEAESAEPRLFVAPEDSATMQERLRSADIHATDLLLGLSPGAMYGPAKRWPPERFGMVGDWAMENWGAKVVVIGSPGEKELGETVCRSMRHAGLNLAGQTSLGESMALINRCQFFLTNDSGLMHVAAALDRPMVAVFGSTDPVATGPRSFRARVIRHTLDCSPCFKPDCRHGFRCLREIQPHEVWNALRNLREDQS